MPQLLWMQQVIKLGDRLQIFANLGDLADNLVAAAGDRAVEENLVFFQRCPQLWEESLFLAYLGLTSLSWFPVMSDCHGDFSGDNEGVLSFPFLSASYL